MGGRVTTKTDTRLDRLTREKRQLVRDLTALKRELAEERARKPLRLELKGEVS